MYEQFRLNNNFKAYLEGTMQSEHVLRMRFKPTPYQKSFKIVSSTEPGIVDFTGAFTTVTMLS